MLLTIVVKVIGGEPTSMQSVFTVSTWSLLLKHPNCIIWMLKTSILKTSIR